jgi:predicted DNA-binding protein
MGIIMEGKKDHVNIGIRFPKDLHERLRKVAFDERRSINKIVLELVERYCEEKEREDSRSK